MASPVVFTTEELLGQTPADVPNQAIFTTEELTGGGSQGKVRVKQDLLDSVLKAESGNRDYASDGTVLTSPKGAKGRMQVLDSTNTDPGFGVIPARDESLEERARVGRDYLAAMLQRYGGNKELALAAYNAGPGRVDAYLEGQTPLPSETTRYVASIMAGGGGGKPAIGPVRGGQSIKQIPAPVLDVANPAIRSMLMEALYPQQGEEEQPESTSLQPPSQANLPDNVLWSIRNPDKQAQLDAMSPTDRFLSGASQGLSNAWTGIKQAGSGILENVTGTLPPGSTDAITQQGVASKQEFEPLRRFSDLAKAGEMIGETAPTLVLPGGVSGNALKRAITSAIVGGIQGATRFTPPEESRAVNAATGATAGGVMSGILSAAGLGGKLATGNGFDNRATQLGEKWNIPTTLSEDLTGQSSRTDVLLERFPWIFGNKGFREKQYQASNNAAKSLFANYVVDPAAMADPTAPSVIMANRAFSSGLFEEVKDLVGRVPARDRLIDPAETKRAATELLSRYPDIFKKLQDTKTEGIIRNIVEDTADIPSQTTVSPIVSATGQPIITTMPPIPKTISFEDAWTARQGLGSMIGQAKKQLASGQINETEYSQFKQLFGAVSDDIDNWAGSIGRSDIASKFKSANEAYRQYVVKYDVLQRAYDKVSQEKGDKEFFSPARFSNELNRLVDKDRYLKKFSQVERDEMAGLANILQVAKRSGQYTENPPTGNRWGMASLLTGAGGGSYLAGGIPGVAQAAGISGSVALLTKFLTTNKFGKKLASTASKIEPTSPAMNGIVTQIYRQLPKFAADEGVNLMAPETNLPN